MPAHAHHRLEPGWTNGLTFAQLSKLDPSKTLPISKEFMADAERRFKWLMEVIWKAVVDLDVLDVGEAKERSQVVTMMALRIAALMDPEDALAQLRPKQYAFPRSAAKVEGFMGWLDEMEQKSVLEISRRPGAVRGMEQAWSDVYVHHSYQKGVARGRDELRAAGYNVPSFSPDAEQDVSIAFNQPIHADRLGLAYTRSFTDLKGITKAMDTQISRVLSEGLAAGRGPMQIARDINDRVSKIGLTRAKTLARTEVMRAHHMANMGEYRNAQAMGIKLVAEWETGATPCDACSSLAQKRVWQIDEIESVIPVHPNCQCVAVPLPADFASKEVKDSVDGCQGYLPGCDQIMHDVIPPHFLQANTLMELLEQKACLTEPDKKRVKRALTTYHPASKALQDLARANEEKLVKQLRRAKVNAVWKTDHEPYDVWVVDRKTGLPKHLIEVKTKKEATGVTADQITMRKECRLRKVEEWESYKSGGTRNHTVLFDERGVATKIYYREGVGNFWIDDMQEVSWKELERLYKTGVGPDTVKSVQGYMPKCVLKTLGAAEIDELYGFETLVVTGCWTKKDLGLVDRMIAKHYPAASDVQKANLENSFMIKGHLPKKSSGLDVRWGNWTPKGVPFDLTLGPKNLGVIDVRTIVKGSGAVDRITLQGDELVEKWKYLRANKAPGHTFLFDETEDALYYSSRLQDLAKLDVCPESFFISKSSMMRIQGGLKDVSWVDGNLTVKGVPPIYGLPVAPPVSTVTRGVAEQIDGFRLRGIDCTPPDIDSGDDIFRALNATHSEATRTVSFIGTESEAVQWGSKIGIVQKDPFIVGTDASARVFTLSDGRRAIVFREEYWGQKACQPLIECRTHHFSRVGSFEDLMIHELGHTEQEVLGRCWPTWQVGLKADEKAKTSWSIWEDAFHAQTAYERAGTFWKYGADRANEAWAELKVMIRRGDPLPRWVNDALYKMEVNKVPWSKLMAHDPYKALPKLPPMPVLPPTEKIAEVPGLGTYHWSKAKTIVDAKAQLRELNIKEVTKRERYHSIDDKLFLERLNSIGEDLARMYNEFPETRAAVKSVRDAFNLVLNSSYTIREDKNWVGLWNMAQNRMELGNLPSGSSMLRNMRYKTRHDVGGNFIDTFRHEFGHDLEDRLRGRSVKVGLGPSAKEREFLGDLIRLKIRIDSKEIMRGISEYADTNHSELFAEMCCGWLNPKYEMGIFPKWAEEFMQKWLPRKTGVATKGVSAIDLLLGKKNYTKSSLQKAIETDMGRKVTIDGYRPIVKVVTDPDTGYLGVTVEHRVKGGVEGHVKVLIGDDGVFISDVYTATSMQGKGLARDTVELLENMASKMGMHHAELQAMYDGRFVWGKLGYKIDGLREQIIYDINKAFRKYAKENGLDVPELIKSELDFYKIPKSVWDSPSFEGPGSIYMRKDLVKTYGEAMAGPLPMMPKTIATEVIDPKKLKRDEVLRLSGAKLDSAIAHTNRQTVVKVVLGEWTNTDRIPGKVRLAAERLLKYTTRGGPLEHLHPLYGTGKESMVIYRGYTGKVGQGAKSFATEKKMATGFGDKLSPYTITFDDPAIDVTKAVGVSEYEVIAGLDKVGHIKRYAKKGAKHAN